MSTFSIVVVILSIAAGIFLFSKCDSSLFTLRLLPYNETTAHQGKVIWVTGASTGIGAELAVDLARAGAQVIISARQEDKLKAGIYFKHALVIVLSTCNTPFYCSSHTLSLA